MKKLALADALYAGGLAVIVLTLYALSFGNGLIFDDQRLTDGTIFGQYGALNQLRPRWLSYGSFVWVQDMFGAGWSKQRVFNVLLHLGTAFAVYRLLKILIERTEFPSGVRTAVHFEQSRTLALRIGVALFALNPVAVYAVAYLIQRSIVMAALFVALACLGFVRGLVDRKPVWFVVAFVCYLLAVLSKEHAVMAIALAVPLYAFVQRPGIQRMLMVSAVAAVVLIVAGAVLFRTYGSILGTAFDETSRAYVLQLEQIQPGISSHLYPLSVFNQATRFFQYGFLWFIPNVTQMSIDIRPGFPLTLLGWPQTAGVLAYLALLVGSGWLVFRRSDALGLAALCVLLPAVLFVTEFATVWLQDPFVLYRSYLWALTIPGLIALLLIRLKPKALYVLGIALACLFAGLTAERLRSLRDPLSVWADAAEKVDSKASANAVGRWRPMLNLGAAYVETSAIDTAHRYFTQAEALGEPMGSARFNMGVTLQELKQHARALEELDKAESKGFTEAALYYHRGESQFALGRFPEAFKSFGVALGKPQAQTAEHRTRQRHAETAAALRDYDTAIADYKILIGAEPDRPRHQIGLSMSYIGKKDFAAALAILDPLIGTRPSGQAYFARALAHFFASDLTASRRDVEFALRAEPNNLRYLELRNRLSGERGSSASDATK